MLDFFGKSIEWFVGMGAFGIYLFTASIAIPLKEKLGSYALGAGIAYATSEYFSDKYGWNEPVVAIAIAIVAPAVINAIMVGTHDKDFLQSTMKEWLRKRLGLGGSE